MMITEKKEEKKRKKEKQYNRNIILTHNGKIKLKTAMFIYFSFFFPCRSLTVLHFGLKFGKFVKTKHV